MTTRELAPLATALVLLAGCAMFRWSGSPDPELAPNWVWSTRDLVISTEPAQERTVPPPPEKLPDTLYYADLGPDAIDVAGYPAQQRFNYALFERECSRCHTLARAVNSPVESRLYWRFHLARMSLHSRYRRLGPIKAADSRALLDFLEYDAQVRKVRDKKAFDAQTEELKRRFEPILKKILEQMSQPAEPPA
ncbi:MAG: hypothetical protein ACHQ49_03025 [Elusimicrobiota bacterium]